MSNKYEERINELEKKVKILWSFFILGCIISILSIIIYGVIWLISIITINYLYYHIELIALTIVIVLIIITIVYILLFNIKEKSFLKEV